MSAYSFLMDSHTSDRIKEYRKRAGLIQADVAKALGVSRATASQWESGEIKNLKLDHFFALCKLLNVNPEWLATGKGQRTPLAPESAVPEAQRLIRTIQRKANKVDPDTLTSIQTLLDAIPE